MFRTPRVISPVTFGRAMARCVDRVRVTVLEQSSNAIGSANESRGLAGEGDASFPGKMDDRRANAPDRG